MSQPFGIVLGRFRFRGRTKLLSRVCEVLQTGSPQGLHASQLAREAGLSLQSASELLAQTPELFVRVKARDGVTRYRLTTGLIGQSPEAIESFIRGAARSEALSLYALVAIVVAFVTMVAAMSLPMFSSEQAARSATPSDRR
jgi:hypothetical protein